MKRVLLIAMVLLLTSCSNSEDGSPKISSGSCTKLAEMLDGSFFYDAGSDTPCTVVIEGGRYYFYSDDQAGGVEFGLEMAVNRSKLKQFNKCVEFKESGKTLTTEQALMIGRSCRKKLGMKGSF